MEIVLALLVVAIASAGLLTYLGQTKKTLETVGAGGAGRPLGHARLTADLATLAAIRNQLDLYRSTHGQWPSSKEASVAVLASPPRFQCAGNDYTFDPATGAIALVIMDPGRC